MKFTLSESQRIIRDESRLFVEEEVAPLAGEFDARECLPAAYIAKLGQAGYFGATLPRSLGGLELDEISFGLINEELGCGCSSTRSLVMLQNMIARTILRWGGDELTKKWVHGIAAGETICSFALSEAEAGSDARNISSTLAPRGEEYILNGQKQWISFGQIADLFLVFALLEGEVCAILVEKNRDGLEIDPVSGMLGLRASQLASVSFKNCALPRENLLGGPGFGLVPVAVEALNFGRFCVAWGCVGIARACLEACLRHTKNREQFGSPLQRHQLIQEMITEMMVNTEAARLLSFQAGQSRQNNHPDAILDCLSAKYFASTRAVKAASDAVQIHGALGCSDRLPVQRYLRDAKMMEIIEGTTQIHQIKIAEFGASGQGSR